MYQLIMMEYYYTGYTGWAIKIDHLRSGLKVYCFGVFESKNLSMQSWILNGKKHYKILKKAF